MQWDVSASRLYKDSWGLRKLYSYALRREGDAFKRGQTPAESRHKSSGIAELACIETDLMFSCDHVTT